MNKLLVSVQSKSYQTRRALLIACTAATSVLVIGALVLTVKTVVTDLSGQKDDAAQTSSTWSTLKDKSATVWDELRQGVGGVTEQIVNAGATSTSNATADTQTNFLEQLQKATQQNAKPATTQDKQ